MKFLIIKLVTLYRLYVSPLFPGRCRYYPTCSDYMIQSLEKKGLVRGLLCGIWRILRCNPFSDGGFDYVE